MRIIRKRRKRLFGPLLLRGRRSRESGTLCRFNERLERRSASAEKRNPVVPPFVVFVVPASLCPRLCHSRALSFPSLWFPRSFLASVVPAFVFAAFLLFAVCYFRLSRFRLCDLRLCRSRVGCPAFVIPELFLRFVIPAKAGI